MSATAISMVLWAAKIEPLSEEPLHGMRRSDRAEIALLVHSAGRLHVAEIIHHLKVRITPPSAWRSGRETVTENGL